jgi:hypothetical protein
MNVDDIVRQLKEERGRLDAAINALEGGAWASSGMKRRGRPRGSTNKQSSPGRTGKRRGMSVAARKRIADAMRKRWAAAKKSGKTRL